MRGVWPFLSLFRPNSAFFLTESYPSSPKFAFFSLFFKNRQNFEKKVKKTLYRALFINSTPTIGSRVNSSHKMGNGNRKFADRGSVFVPRFYRKMTPISDSFFPNFWSWTRSDRFCTDENIVFLQIRQTPKFDRFCTISG